MNKVILLRSTGCALAVVCWLATAAVAAESAAPSDDVAALKANLAQTEDKLAMALRSFTVLSQENDALKAQLTQATAARDAAVTEAAAAAAKVKDAEASVAQASKEMAAVRTAAAAREAESARLREILRQTQDTNAALAAENARLKTELARAKSGGAGTYLPPASTRP
jgi:chromosome segregation ATPase